jgi:hypothetical protein
MCSGNVYSPKIREDLIPVLFKLAKKNNTAMTKVVDEILRHELLERRLIDEEEANYKSKRVEGFFKRQAGNHGLRSTLLHPSLVQHDGHLLEW